MALVVNFAGTSATIASNTARCRLTVRGSFPFPQMSAAAPIVDGRAEFPGLFPSVPNPGATFRFAFSITEPVQIPGVPTAVQRTVAKSGLLRRPSATDPSQATVVSVAVNEADSGIPFNNLRLPTFAPVLGPVIGTLNAEDGHIRLHAPLNLGSVFIGSVSGEILVTANHEVFSSQTFDFEFDRFRVRGVLLPGLGHAALRRVFKNAADRAITASVNSLFPGPPALPTISFTDIRIRPGAGLRGRSFGVS